MQEASLRWHDPDQVRRSKLGEASSQPGSPDSRVQQPLYSRADETAPPAQQMALLLQLLCPGKALCEVDRHDRDHDENPRYNVDHWSLIGPEHIVENPNRQGCDPSAGGESGHNNLVKAQGECEQTPGK